MHASVLAAASLPSYAGISPFIAQTLTQIGVELRGVKTLATLRDGIQECMQYLRKHASARSLE